MQPKKSRQLKKSFSTLCRSTNPNKNSSWLNIINYKSQGKKWDKRMQQQEEGTMTSKTLFGFRKWMKLIWYMSREKSSGCTFFSDGPGSKMFDLGRVSHLWFEKHRIFQLFMFGSKKSLRVWSKIPRVKGGSASFLLQVKTKLGSVRVGSRPISNLFILKRQIGRGLQVLGYPSRAKQVGKFRIFV